jgi:arsenate reductase
MAEGLVNALHGEGYQAFSAGIEPTMVDKRAVAVMAELGIDISSHSSKGLEGFMAKDVDLVITVCDHAKEACPFIAGAKRQLHKSFEDPVSTEGTEDEQLAKFREVRDDIKQWLEKALMDF